MCENCALGKMICAIAHNIYAMAKVFARAIPAGKGDKRIKNNYLLILIA